MVHREVRVPLNFENQFGNKIKENDPTLTNDCLLYTSDAADE